MLRIGSLLSSPSCDPNMWCRWQAPLGTTRQGSQSGVPEIIKVGRHDENEEMSSDCGQEGLKTVELDHARRRPKKQGVGLAKVSLASAHIGHYVGTDVCREGEELSVALQHVLCPCFDVRPFRGHSYRHEAEEL